MKDYLRENNHRNFLVAAPWDETRLVYPDGSRVDVPGDKCKDFPRCIRDFEPAPGYTSVEVRCIKWEVFNVLQEDIEQKAAEIRARWERFRSIGAESFIRSERECLQEQKLSQEEWDELFRAVETAEDSWSGALVDVDYGTAYCACAPGKGPRRLDNPSNPSTESGSAGSDSPSFTEGTPGLSPLYGGESLVRIDWGFEGHYSTSGWSVTEIQV